MQDKAQEGRKRYNYVNGDRSGLALSGNLVLHQRLCEVWRDWNQPFLVSLSMDNDVVFANLMRAECCDLSQSHPCVKEHGKDCPVANAQEGSP